MFTDLLLEVGTLCVCQVLKSGITTQWQTGIYQLAIDNSRSVMRSGLRILANTFFVLVDVIKVTMTCCPHEVISFPMLSDSSE